jgi:2-polyprenyl-6-methoxyphenol hydroxylase-like FAD-dependent oxidoreductase
VSDVTVVGAGPVGLLLATLIGRGGHDVEVLERRAHPYGRPRAVHIDHEAARILQAAGVMDDLPTETMDAYEWRNAAGATLLRLEPPPGPAASGWPASLMFAQPELEARLEAAALATGHVDIRRGHEVTELEVRRSPSSWVVGCDGAASTVRAAMGVAVTDLGYQHDWLVVDVLPSEPTAWRPLNVQICDPARPTTAVSGGPGRRRFEFMRLPDETVDGLADEAAVWRLLEPWSLTPANASLERHATYTFTAALVDRWQVGRLFLAGDAAHQMPPFAGQGLCSGLRDAANLAGKLDLVLRGAAPERILATYGAERAPQVAAEIAFSIDLGRIICILDPAEAEARDAGMLPGAGPIDLPPGPPLGPGLTRPDDPAAGTLSLQPIGLGGRRLDDVIGAGWRLLGVSASDLPAELAVWWESIGGRNVKVDDTRFSEWLAGMDATVVLVRPDFYVWGAGRDPVGLVTELRNSLIP